MTETYVMKKNKTLTRDAKKFFDKVKIVYSIEIVYTSSLWGIEAAKERLQKLLTEKVLSDCSEVVIEFNSGKLTKISTTEWMTICSMNKKKIIKI